METAMADTYDLIVLGSGPGGYVAAIRVAKQLNQGVAHLMKKNKIAVLMGEGKLTGKGKMSVAGADGKATELAAKHIIVATGARARDLPFAKTDGKRIWTYRHAMTPPEMPTELLVIGSGAIGIEFASFYADLGATVTVVEAIAQEMGNKDVHPHALDPKNIPGCTYCRPQVASVGLTEAAAKEKGYQVKVGKFPAIGNGKAIALGEVEGFVKTVFDAKTGELLGAHMIGAEVTELIQGYTVGKTAELIDEDFIQTVFPHPTLSEMMHEAVLAAD